MKCPDPREITFKVQKDGESIRYVVKWDGRNVGNAVLDVKSPKNTARVAWISVEDDFLRCKIGTHIYRRMHLDACRLGLRLASDETRSKEADTFWQKQNRAGRALYVPGSTASNPRLYDSWVLKEKCGPELAGLKRKKAKR